MDVSALRVALPAAFPAGNGEAAAGKLFDGFGHALADAVGTLDGLQPPPELLEPAQPLRIRNRRVRGRGRRQDE